MNDLVATFTSPIWWLSVVIAGIAINLAAAYLKPLLDRRFSLASSWWRARSERQQAERRARVDELSSSNFAQVMAAISDLRNRNRSVSALVMGVFMMLSAQTLPQPSPLLVRVLLPAVAGFLFFISFLSFTSAARTTVLLEEARAVARDRANATVEETRGELDLR